MISAQLRSLYTSNGDGTTMTPSEQSAKTASFRMVVKCRHDAGPGHSVESVANISADENGALVGGVFVEESLRREDGTFHAGLNTTPS